MPEFRALFAAAATAITAQVVSSVVLTVLVFDRTRLPLLSAATFTLGFLPFLVTGTVLSGWWTGCRPGGCSRPAPSAGLPSRR